MTDNELNNRQEVIDTYDQRASRYNFQLRLFDLFSWFGFNISAWRRKAISALNLKPGDMVVDVGCGTGNNFPFLQQLIGPSGTIIGIDLSEAMLIQAQQRLDNNKWENVKLVCSDATQFDFPSNVNAVISTYALTLIPDCGHVISNAGKALVPGGKLVILDMAWPRYCPLRRRHILFFLHSYGVTANVLCRRPWETVQESMKTICQDFRNTYYWFGFFYLAQGATCSIEK